MQPREVMYRERLRKADGRELMLYARAPLPPGLTAPVPDDDAPPAVGSHLRWHPLRSEWVIYAGHRQQRTFAPTTGWSPLAPSSDPARPSEVPEGPWEVAVFENRFAAMGLAGGAAPKSIVDTRPADGRCEVVVFTQDPDGSLGTLELARVALVVDVWAERTAELGALPTIQHVLVFENRGAAAGVSLHHPHGQIYAYPFVPPVAAQHLAAERAHLARTDTSLLAALVAAELEDDQRILFRGASTVSFVPACARFPFEIWIAPRRRVAHLPALAAHERLDLARALRDAVARLDGLFGTPMPYVLMVHQAPTDGVPHPEAHVHIALYPTMRMPGRMKFLAGSELGAGVFAADTLPEQSAAQLRRVDLPG